MPGASIIVANNTENKKTTLNVHNFLWLEF